MIKMSFELLILNTSIYRTQRLSTIYSHVYLRVLFPPGPISSIINEKSWEHTPSKIHSVKRWSTTNQITKIFLHWWTLKPFNIFHVLSWAFPCWVNKAPRLSIRRVIWILAAVTVFVKLNQYSQILRRQCSLLSYQQQLHGQTAATVAASYTFKDYYLRLHWWHLW